MRALWAVIAVLLAALPGEQAEAQVTGRQLLSWCAGALGGSATATFDAFQCEAYLQAVIDREIEDGTDFAGCLGTPRPTAGDLMARILPVLQDDAAAGGDGLSAPANRIVGGWIAAECARPGGAETPEAPAEEAATPPPDPSPQIELAIWQGTQRIEQPAARIRALEHYLEDFPDGRFADLARLQLEDLRSPEPEAEPEQAPAEPAADPEPPDLPPEPTAEADPEPPATDDPAPAPDPIAEEPEPAPDPVVAASPPPDPPPAPGPQRWEDTLTPAERRQAQQALRELGLYRLGIDGIFGNGTRRAIRAFQSSAGTAQTGYLTEEEMDLLLAIAFGSGTRAAAPPVAPSLTVRNRGDSAIVAIYASPTTTDSWQGNHLGGSLLLPEMEYRVPLTNYGTCLFDVRVVDEKNMSLELWSIDACSQARLNFPR